MHRLPFIASLAALASAAPVVATSATATNVIVILADDLGWHDIGLTGSEIKTPNIDRLITEGVRLVDYYGQPVCSPSRSALATARYPIAYGLQTYVIDPAGVDYGLNLNETTMAELFKQYGNYQTHMVGKHHMGMSKWEYTPVFRGFDSFHGFYSGGQDYFSHVEGAGFDLHVDIGPNCGEGCSQVDWANKGRYSTEYYASTASNIITTHDPSKGPLFMYVAFQAVHSPDEVPEQYVAPYNKTIPNLTRRTFAGMLSCLDEGIGNITNALVAAGMDKNTLIIFSADNGGPIQCQQNICGDFAGSTNFPLRGGKHSLWEGGVRLFAGAWGGMLANTGVNRTGLFHHTDVLPTVLEAAGITVPPTAHLPWHGSSQWSMISTGAPSTRTEVLLNIDPLQPIGGGQGNAGIRIGDWKLLVGETGPPNNYSPEFYPPTAEEEGGEDGEKVVLAKTAEWISSTPSEIKYKETRRPYSNSSKVAPYPGNWPLTNMTIQLFNVALDPSETNEVSAQNPTIVQQLMARLEYWGTTVEVQSLFWNATVNPKSNPALHNGSWVPWLD